MKKRKSSDEPESLPSRIYRTLDGVPRNGQWEGEHQKSPIEFVWLCFKLLTIPINAKNRCLNCNLTAAFGLTLTQAVSHQTNEYILPHWQKFCNFFPHG